MDDFEKKLLSHLEAARGNWKLRLKQRVVTARSCYLAPLAMGAIPGSLLADRLYPHESDQAMWLMVAYGTVFLISPLAYIFRRKGLAFEKQRVFYSEALERTLQDRGHLNG